MIEVEGTHGEGGGQILRTSLAMSVLTGKVLRIRNIRARRAKPGLMAQHLRAVEAAAAISGARVDGAKLRSSELTFEPGVITGGEYQFDVSTAGAVTLVLQTIAVPLAFARLRSRVTIIGGTHVPWSPSYGYLERHWAYYLRQSGFSLNTALERAGFYPKGGGQISAEVEPVTRLLPLSLAERGRLRKIRGCSSVACLDMSIAERQRRQALRRLRGHCQDIEIEIRQLAAYSPGTALLLLAEFEHAQCCYTALGARGKPAERVADEAVDALERFVATKAAIDEHLADQLLLPLSVVAGTSELSTPCVTHHLTTNADVIRSFLPVEIAIQGATGSPGLVRIHSTGLPRSLTSAN
ncbi:MAG: RNA 3'-terminal phosphate cyclase [Acidiferrobacterales bacterium]